MYEKLTDFLPKLNCGHFGEWIADKDNDAPVKHLPFVDYDSVVTDFMKEVYRFIDRHKEFGLTDYAGILGDAGIEWGADSMKNADVSSLDGRTVMAMIVGTIRADRFCEGILLEFFEDGCIGKWLERLNKIDKES